MVKLWNATLVAITAMVREALIMPGPYVVSSVAGSIIAYAMSLSSQLSVFGIGIGIAVAYGLASMEVLSVRTVIKLWRVRTNAFYAAVIFTVFALIIEWIVLVLADEKLPQTLRIVGMAFCVLPAIMYALQALNEWTDEQIISTREKETVEAELDIERKRQEQDIQLSLAKKEAEWKVEQQRLKLQNKHDEKMVKIGQKGVKMSKADALEFLRNNPKMGATEAGNQIGATRQTVHNYRQELGQE